MNKKISKISLAIVFISLLIVSLYIGFNDKLEHVFIDVKGDREELEDVNLIYQERQGLYKTTQVNLSKEGMEIKEHAKEIYPTLGMTKTSFDNRLFLNNVYDENQIYENGDILGKVIIIEDYSANHPKMVASIQEKDLKNNNIKDYNIELKNYIIPQEGAYYNQVPIIYKDDLYLAISIDVEPGYKNIDEAGISISKECILQVYKIDLENEESKLILNQNISDKDDMVTINQYISFENNGSAYFVINRYIKEDDDYIEKLELIKYNPDKNKVENIKIDTNLHDISIYSNFENSGIDYGSRYRNIHQYYIHDNKVTFLIDSNIRNDLEIGQITIDLDTHQVENEIYTIYTQDYTVSDNNHYEYYLDNFKILNDKIYLILGNHDTRDNSVKYGESLSREYVYVLDENTKETLYIGKIRENRDMRTNIYIEREGEI